MKAVLILVCFSWPLMANAVTLPYDRPVERELEAPPPRSDTEQPAPIIAPVPPPAEMLSVKLKVWVKHFRFEGNTVFSSEELAAITRPYENQEIDSGRLEAIRQALSRYYIEHGYINSGATLPDQRITDGTVAFRIIEGRLSVIQLSGQDKLHHSYIYDRILLGAESPLNANTLQEQLFLLQQDPRIKRVNARLEPTTVAGESVLYVDVEEADQYQVFFNINNHRPPSVGAERAEVNFVHHNVTGYGDEFSLRYGLTKGLDDADLNYSYPLSANNTRFNVYYRSTDSEVVEDPFASLDVISQSETVGFGFDYPFIRSSDEELIFGVNLEKRKSETFLLGIPYSFEPGPQDGVSRVTALRLVQSWYQRSVFRVLALRSTFSYGFDAMDATINDSDPDGRFEAWLGQFQWLQRFHGNGSDFIVQTNVQLTDNPLLPLEQYAIGGAHSVRGYRENQLVGDNGINFQVEYRYPLTRSSDNQWQIAVFTDYGRVWNKDRQTAEPNDLYSAGIGVRWFNGKHTGFNLYWGDQLRDIPHPDSDLQDDGFHFELFTALF